MPLPSDPAQPLTLAPYAAPAVIPPLIPDSRVVSRADSDGAWHQATCASSESPADINPLNNARSAATGSPVPMSRLDGKALVRIGGIEATVDSWVDSGHIAKDANGYRLAEPGARAAGKAASEKIAAAPQAPKAETLADPAQEQALVGVAEKLGPTVVNHIINDFLAGTSGEPLSAKTIAAATSALGSADHGQTVGRIADALEAIQGQAIQAIESVFPNAAAVYQSALAVRPAEVAKAMKDAIQNRSLEGFRQLATWYLGEIGASHPDWVLGQEMPAGVTTRAHPQYGVMVSVNGQSMPWRDAISSGLIKWGGGKK